MVSPAPVAVKTMYKLKPLFEIPSHFKNSSSMYKMQPLQIRKDNAVIERSHETMESSSKNNELDTDFKLRSLLSHQEQLLAQMEQFKQELEMYSTRINNPPSLQQTSVHDSAFVNPTINAVSQPPVKIKDYGTYDVVIKANPNFPPNSLLAVMYLWNNKLNIKVTTHTHSSVVCLPEHLNQFNSLLELHSAQEPRINVTLIWKNVGTDCQLMLSPIENKIVLGEVNVLRFFKRLASVGADIIGETTCDSVLDIVYSFTHTTCKDRQNLLLSLNDELGDREWFTNSKQISFADIAVWSVFINVGRTKLTLQPKLARWFDKCSHQLSGLNIVHQ